MGINSSVGICAFLRCLCVHRELEHVYNPQWSHAAAAAATVLPFGAVIVRCNFGPLDRTTSCTSCCRCLFAVSVYACIYVCTLLGNNDDDDESSSSSYSRSAFGALAHDISRCCARVGFYAPMLSTGSAALYRGASAFSDRSLRFSCLLRFGCRRRRRRRFFTLLQSVCV